MLPFMSRVALGDLPVVPYLGEMPTNRGSRAASELRREWRGTQREAAPEEARARATFHLPAELLNELRNAVVALSGPPDRLTMSRLAENALRRELERLRQQQAGAARGKPFRQRQAAVTRGRPIG